MVLVELICSASVFLYIVSELDLHWVVLLLRPDFHYRVSQLRLDNLVESPSVMIPLIVKAMWDDELLTDATATMFDLVLLFFMGCCFGKMKDSFIKVNVMNDSIKPQNQTLEHYAAQIEQLTLLEERSRLSRDLMSACFRAVLRRTALFFTKSNGRN